MSQSIQKIKNLRDIEDAALDLRLKELETREAIRNSWNKIKHSMPIDQLKHPLQFLKKEESENEKSLLFTGIKFGAGWLSGKLVEKATERIREYVRRKGK